MRRLLYFFRLNYMTLLGMFIGLGLGFMYWWKFGMLWGVLPLSSECWVNCIYGLLFGGLIGSVLSNK